MTHDDTAGADETPWPRAVLHESVARDLDAQQREAGLAASGQAHAHDDGEHDACAEALGRVHAFLSNQLPATEADLIRAHLDACEKCFDDFDIEATITRLLKRSCQSPCAPESLKVRIMSMRIEPLD